MLIKNMLTIVAVLAVTLVPGMLAQTEDGEIPGDSSTSPIMDSESSNSTSPPPTQSDKGSSSYLEAHELCNKTGTSAHYKEVLIGSGAAMARYTESTTGCPNHVNWALNSNPARETPYNVFVPAYPILLVDSGTTDLSGVPGPVGILLNGVSVASSWIRGTADRYRETAFYAKADEMDVCGGHAAYDGWYRYQNTAGCLQEQAMIASGLSFSDHSPQLGWSYDGFPIYGQFGPGGVEMKACGKNGAHATYCLDSCSGFEAELPGVDAFKYRYYTSCGLDASFFPFTVNCYRGCCPANLPCGEYVEPCVVSGSTEPGYAAGYVPEVQGSLAEPYDAVFIAGKDTDLIGSNRSINCSSFVAWEPSADTNFPTPSPSGFEIYSSDLGILGSDLAIPSTSPSAAPSSMPSAAPSAMPSAAPSAMPSAMPNSSPTDSGGVPI